MVLLRRADTQEVTGITSSTTAAVQAHPTVSPRAQPHPTAAVVRGVSAPPPQLRPPLSRSAEGRSRPGNKVVLETADCAVTSANYRSAMTTNRSGIAAKCSVTMGRSVTLGPAAT